MDSRERYLGVGCRVSGVRQIRRPQSRRGVLMIVVLSMLVLFLLIGTAFLMSSSLSRDAAKSSAKKDRLGNHATRDLERGLLHVLRGTENPHSAIRHHDLLTDMYGTDGFQGVVYSPANVDLTTPAGQATRFAGADAATGDLGPTQGQLIDIYVRARALDTLQTIPDLRHVVTIDRNILGQPQLHSLPLTKGYYNGCLLTITSGPAAGQTARIIDYQYIADIGPAFSNPDRSSRLFRFRVMAFQRRDGQPLQLNPGREPEIADLAGATFLVNGRAFSGTGVGYNPLATQGQPRLSAMQLLPTGFPSNPFVGAEIALTPNPRFLEFSRIAVVHPAMPYPPPFQFVAERVAEVGDPNPEFYAWLNSPSVPMPDRGRIWPYQTFSGPGGANESYTAADFQNMYLALLTVTPRSQARVVHSSSNGPVWRDVSDPAVISQSERFLRLDLEDVPMPSFHRPDLVNFWYYRLLNFLGSPICGFQYDDAVRAIMEPYDANGNLSPPLASHTQGPQLAALIAAVKRKVMLRPTREDHPNFDGGNTRSVPPNLTGQSNLAVPAPPSTSPQQIAIAPWEIVGPWDVDNDNDGVPDSIWVDIGNPIQEAEDGTRYKALLSYLIIDLDSRLNLNAHGLADHIQPPQLVQHPGTGAWVLTSNAMGSPVTNNLAGGATSNALPTGLGYGPAEISLRPVFPVPTTSWSIGNREEMPETEIDSYSTLLDGRVRADGVAIPGKYGFDPSQLNRAATPGTNYQYAPDPNNMFTGEADMPDPIALFKFFNYPWSILHPTAFGTPPDLKSRYALGVDYTGQPVYEVRYDVNPYNTDLPHNLLAKTPYVLDLSSSQRRDTWAGSEIGYFANAAAEFAHSLEYNDDAPFATTELERVLRAFDADTGALPSRLWDLVDAFDPVKLLQFDWLRVRQAAIDMFGVTNPQPNQPESITAAQHLASVARRNVTTDTFDLPVASFKMPAWVSEFGPDGAPGRRNSANNVLNAPGSDDFEEIMGVSVAKATIVDLLRYRVWLEARRFVMQSRGLTEDALDVLNDADYANFITEISVRSELVFSRNPDLVSQLLAPEVIAGQRMDINRPFGSGLANPATGVVDDPLNAGDPYLDVQGAGWFNPNSDRFINLTGNPGPPDPLWVQLATMGLLPAPIAFDHAYGPGVPLHVSFYLAPNNNIPSTARVRNLESQSRQLFARHLYCLMLLLTDANYVAPYEEIAPGVIEPQLKTWIDGEIAKLTAAGVSPEEAAFIVGRKWTCRQIAQWAINVVDARDADAIMTPFEYDENPWNGWGVWDDRWASSDPKVFSEATIIPIDGDPATNENDGWVINWNSIPTTGGPKVVSQLPAASLPTNPLNQTRGVVWGVERPELLITETVAFHDRRTEDARHPDRSPPTRTDPHGTLVDGDPDLDQGLRPRGSLFVEIYNPLSPDGQQPIELYSRLNGGTGYNAQQIDGIDLSRLSNFGVDSNNRLSTATTNVRRSPVWRVIVVEEQPEYRNRDAWDDSQNRRDVNPDGANVPDQYRAVAEAAYQQAANAVNSWFPMGQLPLPPFRPTNPDFDEVFNADFLPLPRSPRRRPTGEERIPFDIRYPYIEREFYFTTDGSTTHNVQDAGFKLRIPDRSIPNPIAMGISLPPHVRDAMPFQTQKFVPVELETANGVQIAPLLPGRYGVIGSAGTRYETVPDSYTSVIGRLEAVSTGPGNPNDNHHHPSRTRRIELRPNTNHDVNQLRVNDNGGDLTATVAQRIGRSNEFADPGGQNIYSAGLFQPAVAIPVDGMNVSEPPWGWAPREWEAATEEQERRKKAGNSGAPLEIRRFYTSSGPGQPVAHGEGRYGTFTTNQFNHGFYDVPFDTASPELYRTGTTPNYRTIHLQRLANPLLPWNPPRGQNGHIESLPVNPYRTVDSSSVDLTAFNGVSGQEGSYQNPDTQRNLRQARPWIPGGRDQQHFEANMENGTQAWYFKSLERGVFSQISATHPIRDYSNPPNPAKRLPPFPQRVLPAQEPVVGWVGDLNQMVPPMVGAEDPGFDPDNPGLDPGDPRRLAIKAIRDGRRTTMRVDEVPPEYRPPDKHQVDMILEHSLGFGNESFATLYDSNSMPPKGAPRPGYDLTRNDGQPVVDWLDRPIRLDSTYPWLAWNSRPFVSAQEILQVPAASSARLLRKFSTINPYQPLGTNAKNWPVRPNPYALAADPTDPAKSLPFGHLLSVFATAADPGDAPHFYRILEYVHVPSRYVGTETMLDPVVFEGSLGPDDPRMGLRPPFNRVSRQRDPGKVNLNTVTGRRAVEGGVARIWSEVYDGIMHRIQDADSPGQLSHSGPAWRDVVLSRKGYAQVNADESGPVEKPGPNAPPDVFGMGLHPNFPSVFSNPFRSPDAGDLVPLPQMMQYGVDASLLRVHPRTRGGDGKWGTAGSPVHGDTRDAGFGDDELSFRANHAIPNDDFAARDGLPLFSESRSDPFSDTDRNPYMMYQPMSRLGNLVTTRSNVFAIWITVGYFEVEPAPNWNHPDTDERLKIRQRFGGNNTDNAPETIAAQALYNRVYPDGYMLGRELGSETGNVKRARGFYIVDRTEEVGFKPGEDLNVERMIRLKRRIE